MYLNRQETITPATFREIQVL